MNVLKDNIVDEFQDKVSELLVRHRSILDSLTKFHESTARINRSIAKAVTDCGCLNIAATKQSFPKDGNFKDCPNFTESHLNGKLCEQCKEAIEEEIGNHLFYLTATCYLLDLDLSEVITKEYTRMNTLGLFHLS